jgi:Uma2 family endonuclease
MTVPLRKNDELFTYRDYMNWPDDERWELIEGIPFDMSPAPSPYHQEILLNLSFEIKKYLKDKICKIYIAPFDVRLPEKNQTDEDTLTVVQPDISLLCDPAKLDERGCKGAPDFIVEILSPYTAVNDMKYKLMLYEKHGVPEYWIVQPDGKVVMVHRLNEQKRYGRAEIYGKDDTIPFKLKEETIEINLGAVF